MGHVWLGRTGLRDEVIVALFLKHEMHVAGAKRVSFQKLEQLPHRSIMRDRIRHGHNGLEPKHTLAVALHDRTTVWTGPFCVLHVVEALAVRLPDVDLDALDCLARRVFYCAEDQTGFPVRVVGDCAAVLLVFRLVGVEGA